MFVITGYFIKLTCSTSVTVSEAQIVGVFFFFLSLFQKDGVTIFLGCSVNPGRTEESELFQNSFLESSRCVDSNQAGPT